MLRRRGHDFTRNRGEIFKPFSQWGKSKCLRENPYICQLPILPFVPSHLEVGWGKLMHGDGKSMGVKIRIWEATHFWKTCF